MKKLFILLMITYSSLAFSQLDWNTLGNTPVPGNFLGTNNNQPLRIRTNSVERFKIMPGGIGNIGGRIAIGNNLPLGFIPQARLHLHQTGGQNSIKFTNATTGFAATDGFNIGIGGAGAANFFQNELEDVRFLFPGQTPANNTFTLFTHNGAGFDDRGLINPTILPGAIDAKLMINDRNPLNPNAPRNENMLLLRTTGWGFDYGVPFVAGQSSPFGNFTLATIQTSSTGGADAGLRIQGSRFNSPVCDIGFIDFANDDPNQAQDYVMARIASGNRFGNGARGYLRFYTHAGLPNNNPLIERMRIDEFGRVGINTFGNPGNSPQNRLEITSVGGDPTPSGLRLTNLTSAAIPVPNPGLGVLTVDPNGDVIYVPGGAGGLVSAHNGTSLSTITPNFVAFGQDLAQVGNPGMLLNDREVPMNNFNVYFTGQGVNNPLTDNIYLGYPTAPLTPVSSKFSAIENVGNVSTTTYAGHFRNINIAQGMLDPDVIGVAGISDATQTDPTARNIGGYFRAQDANLSTALFL
jgi:hypothetical protein